MMNQFVWANEKKAADRVKNALELPIAPDSDMLGVDGYFDPWEVFNCALYGSYASAFDQCAIQILEEFITKDDRRKDLGAEMFREMLCTNNLCDYGTSPRFCFPTQEFAEILPALIAKWKEYYAIVWDEPYVYDPEDI